MGCVANTLLRWGYRSDDTRPLLPALAKFWFRHELGPLVVYPLQNAVRSAHMVLSGQRKIKASSDKEDLAFVLPLSAGLRNSKLISKADRQLYGTGRAKAVYHGGGPFMLRRSHCLTMNVLRRLGYLDDCLNSDLNEGLLSFLNSSRNKQNMRIVGTMPEIGDLLREIQRKINHALVSGQSFEWSLAPSDMDVRKTLVAERLLVIAQQPREEVLTAMQEYARRHGLRAMKSYNVFFSTKAVSPCLWSFSKRWGEAELLAEMTFAAWKSELGTRYNMFLLHVICHCSRLWDKAFSSFLV